MTARSNFKKSYGIVRKMALEVKGNLIGIGIDGKPAICAGFAYEAGFAAMAATAKDHYAPNGDPSASSAAINAILQRAVASAYPMMPAHERIAARRADWDGAYDYI